MVYPESESKEQVKPSENQPAEVQETTELHKKLESKNNQVREVFILVSFSSIKQER